MLKFLDDLKSYQQYGFPWKRPDIILSSIFINLLSFVLPLSIIQLFDRIIPYKSVNTLVILTIIVTVSIFFDYILTHSRSRILSWMGINFEHDLNILTFSHLIFSKREQMGKHAPGVYIENIDNIPTIKEFLAGQGFLTLIDLMFVLLFLLVLWYLAHFIIIVPILCIIFFLSISIYLYKKLNENIESRHELDNKRHNLLIQILENYHTVKGLGVEIPLFRRYERLQNQNAIISYKVNFYANQIRDWGTLTSYAILTGIVGYAAFNVNNNVITLGAMSACIILSNRILSPFQALLAMWIKHQEFQVALRQIDTIFSLPVSESKNNLQSEPLIKTKVEVKNLGFSFDAKLPKEKWLFKTLSFIIPKNTITGLTGPNGSGKTTLVHVLKGDIDPLKGKILIDNTPIENVDPDLLRDRVAYLPPKGELFTGSIMDNITMFRKENYINQAIETAKFLDFHRWVLGLPNGYNTIIGDDLLVQLPSGIHQRICLARALLKEPELLILDESNTFLDRQSDEDFIAILNRLKSILTIVIISHRPSTLKIAEQVLHLSDGEINITKPSDLIKDNKK